MGKDAFVIICADSTQHTPFNIRGNVKLLYCDPPRRKGYNDRSDTLSFKEFQEFTISWLTECIPLLSENSTMIICTDPRNRRLFEHLIHHNNISEDLRFKQEVIWHYEFGVYTKRSFVPSHENILVYQKGRPPFNWQDVAIESQRLRSNDSRADHRGRTPGSVWSIPRVPGNSNTRKFQSNLYRISQQPEALVERIIRTYTNENDVVFDPFSGTGTTVLIAKKLKRRAYAQEVNEEYIKASLKRLKLQPWMKFMDIR